MTVAVFVKMCYLYVQDSLSIVHLKVTLRQNHCDFLSFLNTKFTLSFSFSSNSELIVIETIHSSCQALFR